MKTSGANHVWRTSVACRRNGFRAVFLVLALFPAFASAQARKVSDIVEQVRLHGYDSPSVLIETLQAASDRPGASASPEAQRLYFATMGQFASAADDEKTLRVALQGLESAGAQGCRTCLAQALILRGGWTLTREGAMPALKLVSQAEAMLGPDAPTDVRAHLLSVRARTHRLSGNYAKSVKDAVQTMRLADQTGNAAWQVEMNIMLGLDNAGLGDYARADRHIDEAIKQAQAIGYGYQLAYAYLNLGHISSLEGDREAQLKALNTALKLSDGKPDLSEVEMISLSNLADYHLVKKNYPLALDYARRAGGLARSINEQRSLSIALINEGLALAGMGQVEPGIARVGEAIAIAQRMGNRDLVVGMSHELIGIYEREGRYKEANAALHEVAGLEKQMTVQERERDVLALQEEFAAERKQREIERLSADNARKQALVEARNAQRWMWLAVAVALAMAALFLIRRLSGARKVNVSLSKANVALEQETTRDPLTGTFNRRHFQNLMSQASDVPPGVGDKRRKQPFLSLAVLDLDHFKHINDSYGHDAGDAVLVEVANRLTALVRAEDSVVRWGGEEFVLVLPGTDADGAETIVSRVLQLIGSTPVMHLSQVIPVTVSAGCATIPENGTRAWRFAMQVADLALYRAKASGRNRAVCVSELDDARLGTGDRVIDLNQAESNGHANLRILLGPSPDPG